MTRGFEREPAYCITRNEDDDENYISIFFIISLYISSIHYNFGVGSSKKNNVKLNLNWESSMFFLCVYVCVGARARVFCAWRLVTNMCRAAD